MRQQAWTAGDTAGDIPEPPRRQRRPNSAPRRASLLASVNENTPGFVRTATTTLTYSQQYGGVNVDAVLHDVKKRVYDEDCKFFGQMHNQLSRLHYVASGGAQTMTNDQRHELHMVQSMVRSRLQYCQGHIRQEFEEMKRMAVEKRTSNESTIGGAGGMPSVSNQKHLRVDSMDSKHISSMTGGGGGGGSGAGHLHVPSVAGPPGRGVNNTNPFVSSLTSTARTLDTPADSRPGSALSGVDYYMNSPKLPASGSGLSLADESPLDIAMYVMEKFGDVGNTKLERLASMEFTTNGIFKYPHLLMKPHLRQYWKEGGSILVREDREHKAGWNELFFDLIFVVVFSHLSMDLEYAQSLRGLAEFSVLFVAVWRIWSSWNTYINRYNPTDAFHKCFYLIEMIFVTGIVIHSVNGVVGSYALARVTSELAGLWAASFNGHVPAARYTAIVDFVVLLVALIPWFLSTTIKKSTHADQRPDPAHLVYWTIGLCIEIAGKVLTHTIQSLRLPVCWEHLNERFGLMMIIMLGEYVVAVIFLAPVASYASYIIAICGGLIVYSMQILYFDVEGGPQKRHALVQGNWRTTVWYLVHAPLYAAVLVSANGLHGLLIETLTGSYYVNSSISFVRGAFCWSNSCFWLLLALMGMLHDGFATVHIRKRTRIGLRCVLGLAVAVLPLAGDRLAPVTYVIITTAVAVTLALVDLYGGIPYATSKIQPFSTTTQFISGNLL